MLEEGKKSHWELEEGISTIKKYFGDHVLIWISVRKERCRSLGRSLVIREMFIVLEKGKL